MSRNLEELEKPFADKTKKYQNKKKLGIRIRNKDYKTKTLRGMQNSLNLCVILEQEQIDYATYVDELRNIQQSNKTQKKLVLTRELQLQRLSTTDIYTTRDIKINIDRPLLRTFQMKHKISDHNTMQLLDDLYSQTKHTSPPTSKPIPSTQWTKTHPRLRIYCKRYMRTNT